MRIQASVIEELRSMFKRGATPSRLIQHIVNRHPTEGNWHGLIQDYFREGFGVPIVRGLDPMENYEDIDLRLAYLNEEVLHQMVQTRVAWDHDPGQPDEASPSWLDSRAATSDHDCLEESSKPSIPPDLAASWDRLTDRERQAIVLANSTQKRNREMVLILSRLAERLQQRIIALEQDRSPSAVEERSSS